ncbi:MAG: hypothetical protein ABSG91_23810, partial [Syntrophobacteraceae bacterium]
PATGLREKELLQTRWGTRLLCVASFSLYAGFEVGLIEPLPALAIFSRARERGIDARSMG